jgi:hypothetical protein
MGGTRLERGWNGWHEAGMGGTRLEWVARGWNGWHEAGMGGTRLEWVARGCTTNVFISPGLRMGGIGLWIFSKDSQASLFTVSLRSQPEHRRFAHCPAPPRRISEPIRGRTVLRASRQGAGFATSRRRRSSFTVVQGDGMDVTWGSCRWQPPQAV